MNFMNTEALKGFAELGRVAAMALVSYLLTEGVLGTVLGAFGFHFTPEQKLVIVGLILSVLKAVDKWLHELGKSTGSDSLTRGLTRF